jgi:SRSO17 transposase
MKALNAYSLALILNEGSFSCVKASESLGFVSHDHLTRQLAKDWMPSPVADWSLLPRQGVLVIDDTVVAKPHSKAIDGVKWQYDSSRDKVLPGINLLLFLWVADETVHVLSVQFPGEANRNELVQETLKELKAAGFEPERVLFDAWYAASKTLNLIHSCGWTYVCRIRGNRLFNGQAIETYRFHGAQGRRGKLNGVYSKVQIVKHGDRYLATNELTTHTSLTLAERYGERWVVETVFRDLKSILHLEKCSCRNLEAQFNHALCVLEAYLYLRQAFPAISVQAAQQECLRLYRCPNCRPDLNQLVRA